MLRVLLMVYFLSCSYNVVEVSPSEGVLPAYLRENIKLTLRPSQCVHYSCTLSYELITKRCKLLRIIM